jgi:hypothetical protein
MMTKSPGVDENGLPSKATIADLTRRRMSSLRRHTGIVDGHTIVDANSSFCQLVRHARRLGNPRSF